MEVKQFDRAAYDLYDAKGKAVAVEWFSTNTDYEVRELEKVGDKFAPDFALYYDGDFHGYLEVEIKNTWDTDIFPFKSIHVPYRKCKFIYPGVRTWFFLINRSMTRAALIDGNDVIYGQEQKMKVSNNDKEETFKQIDLKVVAFVRLV
jgi:hypothetical protein